MGVDPSEGFISHARRVVGDTRAEFRVGDAQSLPADNRAFDVAVAGLVINFVPDMAKPLRKWCALRARVERRRPTFGTMPATWR